MAHLQVPNLPNEAVRRELPLGGKLRMRFYEPLVLLRAATQACMHNLAPKTSEPNQSGWNQNPEQLFHDFMNKMAQICDTQPRGPTVTAVVALSHPDRVEYRFASNQRSSQDLEQLREFVTDILQTLQGWTEDTSRLTQLRVLRKVVIFTRPRLEVYVRAVASSSDECLRTEGLAPRVTQKLHELHEMSFAADAQGLDEDTFFTNCSGLMNSIRGLSRSSIYRTFRDKANLAITGQVNPWAEMRHAAGRLLSYLEGVETLVDARAQPQWARLFYDFEIVCIPSSEPHPNPIVGRRKTVGAAEILGRMTSSDDKEKLADFQAGAIKLQKFDLDENIRKLNQNRLFRPIIHAEILIHESMRDLHAPQYFGGYRYIATSKPTCRLCEYYFQALFRVTGDQVQVRKSHGNLYINWRVPDVFDNQTVGESAKRRDAILNHMVGSVRQDTYLTLQGKFGGMKRYDSNTSRTYNREADFDGGISSLAEDDLEDVSSMMGGVSLED